MMCYFEIIYKNGWNYLSCTKKQNYRYVVIKKVIINNYLVQMFKFLNKDIIIISVYGIIMIFFSYILKQSVYNLTHKNTLCFVICKKYRTKL